MTNDQTKKFGETAKSLARNPLGIIALFIVMVYGFAALSPRLRDRSRQGSGYLLSTS